jgi:hypothetical protein
MGKMTESGFIPAPHRIRGVQGNTRTVSIKCKATDLTGAVARAEFRRTANGEPFLVFSSAPVLLERSLTITVVPATVSVPTHSIISFTLTDTDTRAIGELAIWNLDITDSLGAINTFIVGEAVFSAEGYSSG